MSSTLRQHVTNVPHPQHPLLRRQLSAAGKVLRHEFYVNNPDPTLEQERELNVAISRLPGCAWYKDERKLQANYASSVRGTRRADGDAGACHAASGESMDVISHFGEAAHARVHAATPVGERRANGTAKLAILLSTCPDPDLAKMLEWARRCGLEPARVFAQCVAAMRSGRDGRRGRGAVADVPANPPAPDILSGAETDADSKSVYVPEDDGTDSLPPLVGDPQAAAVCCGSSSSGWAVGTGPPSTSSIDPLHVDALPSEFLMYGHQNEPNDGQSYRSASRYESECVSWLQPVSQQEAYPMQGTAFQSWYC